MVLQKNYKAFLMVCMVWPMLALAQKEVGPYRFDHGPYLQGLTDERVTVYFTTSEKGFSSIELREPNDGTITRHVTIDDGLIQANNTLNAIALKGLKPDTRYEYRLFSTRIKQFRLSRNVYTDTIRTDWYSFKTVNPKAAGCTFVTTSDIHDDAKKYERLLSHTAVDQADMVFLLGDILSHFSREGQPYSSFIDVSVDKFAKEIPFVLIRGNHDTRGSLSRTYDRYIQRPDKHFYGVYSLGDTFFILLDTGEDKPDSHHDYSGLTAFEDYRKEQAEWLKQVVKTKAFKAAKHRIVMAHIPPIKDDGTSTRVSVHGPDMVYKLYLPILNKEKIDLMISGHTHRFQLIEKNKNVNNFPILINDNDSMSLYTVSAKGVHVKTVNSTGEVTMERTFVR
ncbi:phosphoesterase [Sphingobacterium sp. SGG-5]|uniref:metallophosphoesterase family protein n=1 Tax=Sphingobacterium sp. SGG-5 TaxID=2710881 RepID=UPI0013EC534D|nr:metallophosphoesterase [Sphingobacterium sp. SGG-5]NGM62520.1 phosphoesterase [Sphingobacterium sp. SGG-5]